MKMSLFNYFVHMQETKAREVDQADEETTSSGFQVRF